MGGEYAAGYYGYLWSAVLDSDAFQAFRERGDLFDPETARSFRANILEKGGSEDPLALYRRFRGRAPSVEPFLRKRGLG
jgi:peptidyl-dipeptidase Dcp